MEAASAEDANCDEKLNERKPLICSVTGDHSAPATGATGNANMDLAIQNEMCDQKRRQRLMNSVVARQDIGVK